MERSREREEGNRCESRSLSSRCRGVQSQPRPPGRVRGGGKAGVLQAALLGSGGLGGSPTQEDSPEPMQRTL